MSSALNIFYNNYHRKNDKYSSIISRRNFTYWHILNFVYQYADHPFTFKSILDVGCGVGTLALYLAQHAKIVVGLDVSSRAISLALDAQKENQVINCIFRVGELLDFQIGFDFIVCTEVIEHIADDRDFAKLLAANLNSDGMILLTTPNADNLLTRMGYYRKFDREVGHLRRYSVGSLTQVLKSVGLDVIEIKLVEGPLRSILFTSRLGFLIKFIKGPLIDIFHLVDSWLGKLAGYSDIMVLAKKSRGDL